MFKKIANAFGYTLIKKKKSPSLATHLALILEDLDIDLVIDVGANEGQFGKFLRGLGYQGSILSFEPVLKTYEKLAANSAPDSRWEIERLALSDTKGPLVINTFESSDLSSILRPNDFGCQKFPKMQTAHEETILSDTLDNVLRERQLTGKRILLKMDTQGYDLNVFKGAINSLRQFCGILSEISFKSIYENMPDYHQVLTEYEKAGFSVTGLYPVSRDKNLAVIEMDCVLVRA